ncbi:SURF1 family cytochrome oxidase biogenesis protein, partial [Streptomyces sp. NPDC005568]|uniref:SURF1 family cytochrome oxidase biogenesis protein n=1 Tax=Streptomyces sp. NPDC005568 TaxID=3156887 RepID=UPI0033AD9EF3
MYRFLLTPRWWGINVFVLLAIPFCVFMGSWQLGRFEDRVQDHRTATEQAASAEKQAARPLDELLPVDRSTSGATATATGRYGRQLLVPGRELDGRRGYYVSYTSQNTGRLQIQSLGAAADFPTANVGD